MFILGDITGQRLRGSRPHKSSASQGANVNMSSPSISLCVNRSSKQNWTSHTPHSLSTWYHGPPSSPPAPQCLGCFPQTHLNQLHKTQPCENVNRSYCPALAKQRHEEFTASCHTHCTHLPQHTVQSLWSADVETDEHCVCIRVREWTHVVIVG